MPRTVPKTMARELSTTNRKTANSKRRLIETLSPRMRDWAAALPRAEVDQQIGRAGGASGGRRGKTRRRRERFDRTKLIPWHRESDVRLSNGRCGDIDRQRQHEDDGRDGGAAGIVTTGHGACRHDGPVTTAIHSMIVCNGRMRGMIPMDWALARCATRRGIERPSSSRERRIEQKDRGQTHRRDKRTPILRPRIHLYPKPASIIRQKVLHRAGKTEGLGVPYR